MWFSWHNEILATRTSVIRRHEAFKLKRRVFWEIKLLTFWCLFRYFELILSMEAIKDWYRMCESCRWADKFHYSLAHWLLRRNVRVQIKRQWKIVAICERCCNKYAIDWSLLNGEDSCRLRAEEGSFNNSCTRANFVNFNKRRKSACNFIYDEQLFQ